MEDRDLAMLSDDDPLGLRNAPWFVAPGAHRNLGHVLLVLRGQLHRFNPAGGPQDLPGNSPAPGMRRHTFKLERNTTAGSAQTRRVQRRSINLVAVMANSPDRNAASIGRWAEKTKRKLSGANLLTTRASSATPGNPRITTRAASSPCPWREHGVVARSANRRHASSASISAS